MKLVVAGVSFIVAMSSALAQSPACKVLDPELRGSYSGGCIGGLAQGKGEARGIATYVGEFVAGRKHGRGVKTWPATGDRYEGDFVADRKEGKGTYVWGSRSPSAGERYSGDYLGDRRHGDGVYEWPGGDRYSGPWDNDAPTGAPTKGMIARARALAERAAVIGVPGTRVCRELRVGVATLDIVRGTVLGRRGDAIRLRIDDAGKFEHVLDGRAVHKGDVLDEPIRYWLPCS
ncbi:MAG TPA: hypothetical protein VHP37_03330 [Burkholderiales bacterium]|nr:hypothetical protein [Burkholderiales bacterium]